MRMACMRNTALPRYHPQRMMEKLDQQVYQRLAPAAAAQQG
jgi:hypothetical protein